MFHDPVAGVGHHHGDKPQLAGLRFPFATSFTLDNSRKIGDVPGLYRVGVIHCLAAHHAWIGKGKRIHDPELIGSWNGRDNIGDQFDAVGFFVFRVRI